MHHERRAQAISEVCLRKVGAMVSLVATLAAVPSLGATAGPSAAAATGAETRSLSQTIYRPAPPQNWSEMELAMQEANARKTKEARYASLQTYLAGYGSPLSAYAKDFIDAGDKYGVDYKVVVAIAGREQTFGVNWPGSSNNFWGYGGYYWPDVSTAIWEYTRCLSEEYPDLSKGDIYGSASRYAASSTWASGVSEFYTELSGGGF